MIPAWIIAVGSVAVFSGYTWFIYDLGGDNRENKINAKAGTAVIDEKAKDDAAQSDSAASDRQIIVSEIARLRRLLNERNAADVPDGRNCIVADDAAGLLDDYNAIFEERLQAGHELDGAERTP